MTGDTYNQSNGTRIMTSEKSIPIGAAPLYRQIHHELRHLIVSGKILPGEPFPSEKEISRTYNVSRFTVQQVFRLLVQEGLVVRRQGLGTFVRQLAEAQRGERITLQLGRLQCAAFLQIQALNHFARRVAELTRNQLRIEIGENALLGSASQQLQQVCSGQQAMFSAGTDWLEELEPCWGVTNLPFLFQSMDHVHRYVKSETAQSLRVQLLENRNIRVLADNWVRPSRLILATRPCFEVEDFAELRLRVPAIPMYHHIWNALGAEPIEMAWEKTSVALQDKVIDAVDAPRDIAQQEGFHRCARYVTNTRHLFPRACILISEKVFSTLRADVQQALVEAAQEAGEAYSQTAITRWRENQQLMVKDGARFIETDTEPFRKKTEALYQTHSEFQTYIESIVSMQSIQPAIPNRSSTEEEQLTIAD